MFITISGPSGSGKSTIARMLSDRLGIPTMDVGEMFKKEAKRKGMPIHRFVQYVDRNPEFDRHIDETTLRRAVRTKDIIFQSRLAAWLATLNGVPAVRIWIDAPTQTRASRIAEREGKPYKETLKAVAARDRSDRARYRKLYGLDLKDLSVYDIVVQTGNRSAEQVISVLLREIPKIWRMKRKTRRPKVPQRPKNR